ncbi:zinc finger [Striga asiatica]|uniref:Zinc finger n=1 Tax=Striga asiatica TaxID=4170 RepID=A0A5A7RDR0_STRAF|nr:zinc finger [Striga asiatica]
MVIEKFLTEYNAFMLIEFAMKQKIIYLQFLMKSLFDLHFQGWNQNGPKREKISPTSYGGCRSQKAELGVTIEIESLGFFWTVKFLESDQHVIQRQQYGGHRSPGKHGLNHVTAPASRY